MSKTLCWTTLDHQTLAGGNSSVATALSKAFGEFPITLDMGSMDKLLGMAATCTTEPNPYDLLANAIVEFGTIEVALAG